MKHVTYTIRRRCVDGHRFQAQLPRGAAMASLKESAEDMQRQTRLTAGKEGNLDLPGGRLPPFRCTQVQGGLNPDPSS